MTIGHLENQLLGGTRLGDESEREYIDRLIEAAEEFLMIFEGKTTTIPTDIRNLHPREKYP